VIDPKTQAQLQEVAGRESRSLLLYVGDAYPWTAAPAGEALAILKDLIAEERQAVTAVGQFLVRRRLPPPLPGSYPTSFTSVNFLSLEYLMPRLIGDQRRLIEQLQRDLAAVRDPAARVPLEALLAVKRRHLPALEALAAAPSAKVTS
jgi:hypothetical protein